MEAKLYISGIAYEIGEPHQVNSIKGSSSEQTDLLESIGIKHFCKSNESIYELSYRSIIKTLNKTTIKPADIESVIFSTTIDTIHSVGIDLKQIDKVLKRADITNAFVYGSFLSKCSNLTTALHLASGLLKSGLNKHIVIVVVDKLLKDTERLTDSNESVLSDGAASLILTKERGDFELLHIDIRNDLSHLSKEYNIFEFIQNSSVNLKKLWEDIAFKFELPSFEKIFFGNYNNLVQKSFTYNLKIDTDKFFFENIEKIGHVFSADVLINMQDYLDKNKIDNKSRFCCFTAGYFRWGVFIVEKVPSEEIELKC